MSAEFWRYKKLGEMTSEEWEAVCDGCGRCCLHKIQDEDTLEVAYTWVACRYLDVGNCRCIEYPNRKTKRKNCLHLTPDLLELISWLPETCAYRLLHEGKDLPAWHPLVSGDPESIHASGISVQGKAIPEDHVDPEELELYVIE